MQKPFFSIIIPTYNRSELIRSTINSVLEQTYMSFELIVVDDGSTDDTDQVVKAIEDDRVLYFKKENAERGAARNYGVARARGTYVTFLDSDDRFYSNHLSEAKKFLSQKGVNIFFQAYEILNNKKNIQLIFPNQEIEYFLLNKGNVMSCHGVFLERNFAKLNPFNEDFRMSGLEDYELWIRIAAQTKIHHNPIITSCLIDHSDRSVIQVNKEKLITKNELFLKYIFSNELTATFCIKFENKIKASVFSYIALHLALSNYKADSIKYCLKAIFCNPRIIFFKRFSAIVKHLIL